MSLHTAVKSKASNLIEALPRYSFEYYVLKLNFDTFVSK
jgi:hypothetical protein